MRLLEICGQIVFASLVVYVLFRVFRPRTMREIAGRPRSFMERLAGSVEAYCAAEDPELRHEIEEELRELFRSALVDHGLEPDAYRLVLDANELDGPARVQRVADGTVWSLVDFDDHLLVRGARPVDTD